MVDMSTLSSRIGLKKITRAAATYRVVCELDEVESFLRRKFISQCRLLLALALCLGGSFPQ